jgi:hypothetical protein
MLKVPKTGGTQKARLATISLFALMLSCFYDVKSTEGIILNLQHWETWLNEIAARSGGKKLDSLCGKFQGGYQLNQKISFCWQDKGEECREALYRIVPQLAAIMNSKDANGETTTSFRAAPDNRNGESFYCLLEN